MCDNERIRDIFRESENTWRAMHEFGNNRARKNLLDCNFCKDCEERCVLKAIEICEFR